MSILYLNDDDDHGAVLCFTSREIQCELRHQLSSDGDRGGVVGKAES